MTTTDARAQLALGATTLRQLARHWRCTPAEAYARIYDRPMPAPVRPAGPERKAKTRYRRPR